MLTGSMSTDNQMVAVGDSSEVRFSSIEVSTEVNNQSKTSKIEVQQHKAVHDTAVDTDGDKYILLYDVNGIDDDKFMNSIMFYTDIEKGDPQNQCLSLLQCMSQSKYRFGFIPLTDPILPKNRNVSSIRITDPIDLHNHVTKSTNPNFMGLRIPIPSQLNIEVWKQELGAYWDQQLLEFLQFGFPLGFNFACELKTQMTIISRL